LSPPIGIKLRAQPFPKGVQGSSLPGFGVSPNSFFFFFALAAAGGKSEKEEFFKGLCPLDPYG
jgi:hypothetical protein